MGVWSDLGTFFAMGLSSQVDSSFQMSVWSQMGIFFPMGICTQLDTWSEVVILLEIDICWLIAGELPFQ